MTDELRDGSVAAAPEVTAWYTLRAELEERVLRGDAQYPDYEGGWESCEEDILERMDDLVPPPADAVGEWYMIPPAPGFPAARDGHPGTKAYRRKLGPLS